MDVALADRMGAVSQFLHRAGGFQKIGHDFPGTAG
jgi:hypothetical protein